MANVSSAVISAYGEEYNDLISILRCFVFHKLLYLSIDMSVCYLFNLADVFHRMHQSDHPILFEPKVNILSDICVY